MDFTKHRNNKSAEQVEFDNLCDDYAAHFGKPYSVAVGFADMTLAETCEDIRQRIANNNPQTEPKYNPNEDY